MTKVKLTVNTCTYDYFLNVFYGLKNYHYVISGVHFSRRATGFDEFWKKKTLSLKWPSWAGQNEIIITVQTVNLPGVWPLMKPLWYTKELSLVFLDWSISIYTTKKFSVHKHVQCVHEVLSDTVSRVLLNDHTWAESNAAILWEEKEKSNKFAGLNALVLV